MEFSRGRHIDEQKQVLEESFDQKVNQIPRWRWRFIGILSVIAAIVILLAITYPR